MASSKAIRERIQTVKLTRQITQTMKMVAASSLEKRKQEKKHLTAHANSLDSLLAHLAPTRQEAKTQILLTAKPVKKRLMIIVGTEKGMCGAFPHTVLEGALAHYTQALQANQRWEFLPIGKKMRLFLQHKSVAIPHLHTEAETHFPSNLKAITTLSHSLLNRFPQEYQQIDLLYQPQALSPKQETLVRQQLLPIKLSDIEPTLDQATNLTPIVEPNAAAIWSTLLPELFTLQLAQALITSRAAEEKARMVAMHQATENADTLIQELELLLNSTRQTKITTEIAEINAGAKFLRG